PGFKKFIVKPYIPGNDLDWVSASVNTIHGTIASSWRKKQEGLYLDIKVPSNTTAIVYLPASPGAIITEGGNQVSQTKRIRSLPSGSNESIFEVGSGSYSFFVSDISKRK
nr:hypothetical protein [Saprospiraceae bacterium]